MTILWLVIQFLIVGSLTFGGGLVAVTLLFDRFVVPGLVSERFYFDILTIAESTPGPIAINLATILGFTQAGVWGGLLTSFSFILPSVLLLWMAYPWYQRYRHLPVIQSLLIGLRLVIFGLIAITLVKMGVNVSDTLFRVPFPTFVLLAMSIGLLPYTKKRPYLLLVMGALFGIFFF